jgi:protein O-GlcNAc transferase
VGRVVLRPALAGLILFSAVAAAGAQTAADLPPRLAERFSKGVAALEAGRLDEAEAAFRRVLTEGGARAFVHHNLGIVQQRRGRHADAVRAFQAAIRLDPKFGPARLLAGSSLLALGRVSEALPELRRAVALMPREVAARRQLADALERTGDFPGLADEYRRIVELSPGNEEYVYRLGKAYLKLAQWSIERMQTIDPRTARLKQSLGLAYVDQGRPDLAIAAFEEAARLDGKLPEVHLALARIHLDQGRWQDAAREVDRELALVPESAAARELKKRIDAARPKP